MQKIMTDYEWRQLERYLAGARADLEDLVVEDAGPACEFDAVSEINGAYQKIVNAIDLVEGAPSRSH